jgi:protein-disulfide isomerase
VNTSRIIVALVSLTVLLQLSVLYQQRQNRPPRAPDPQESVENAPADTLLPLDGLPIMGDEGAELVLAEFADYECPFCARHATGVAKQIMEKYVSAGVLRMAFVNFPLGMHSNARFLANAALCAGEQDRYWEMHDAFFEAGSRTREDVLVAAGTIGLALDEYVTCLDVGPVDADQIEKDIAVIEKLGFRGTPSFALGYVNDDGQVVVERYIRGAVPFETFETAIEELISERS